MEHIRYLIIGAGISGLSYANFINSDDYLIIEKDPEIGGYCKTTHQDGFVWDYAGHFFHFRDPEIKKQLVDAMTPESVMEVKRNSKISYKSKLIDYPFQKNIHQLPFEEFIECLYDLYFRDNKDRQDNFEEMLYSEFGKSITEKFLIPYNEKVYACSLNELESGAMGRFFPHANIDEIIRNFRYPDNASYNATFLYPKDGVMEFVKVLAEGVIRANIATTEEVTKIDIREKTAHTSRRKIRYEYLISSVPFNSLLEMAGCDYKKETLSWNKVLVFNLGFNAKGPKGIHWIYFPEKEYRFYRVGFYDNILQSERMSLYIEVGMKPDCDVDVEKELDCVLADLKKAGILGQQELVCSQTVVMNPAYVHISKASEALFSNMSNTLGMKDVYTLGRYGRWGYCSMEDCIIEARELAGKFNQQEPLRPG
ncbi:MAG: protoporphyrinogen/coproporphyrinogen oxidase [Planctomycetota bacterium]|jgi:protoporphyrinogen oxidase